MMHPEVFRIQLEKNVYLPGEVIKGNVIVDTRQEIDCHGLHVSLIGKGLCFWETTKNHGKHAHGGSRHSSRNTVRHTRTQIYASSFINLWRRDDGANEMFPQCQKTFPFTFELPLDLPSSFVHKKDNYVSYSAYAHFDMIGDQMGVQKLMSFVGLKSNISTRMFFTVIQPIAAATMLTPLYNNIRKEINPQGCIPPFCCFNIPMPCLGSYGTITIGAYLERTAYAPGEMMNLLLKVESTWPEAEDNIKLITAALVQKVFMNANANGHDDNRKKERRTVTEAVVVNHREIVKIQVPSLPPTFYGTGGDPITWSYSINITVKMEVPGCALDRMTLRIPLPVIICAIGLDTLSAEQMCTSRAVAAVQGVIVGEEGTGALYSQQGVVVCGQLTTAAAAAAAIEADYEASALELLQKNSAEIMSKEHIQSSAPPLQQSSTQYAAVSQSGDMTVVDSTDAIVATQQMDRNNYTRVTPQPFTSGTKNDLFVTPPTVSPKYPIIPDWKTIPQIREVLPVLATKERVSYSGSPLVIRESKEDSDVADSALICLPQYYWADTNNNH